MAEKRLIEDKINSVLNGDKQKIALDFAAFMRTNGFSIEGDENDYGWGVSYKGNGAGFIKFSGVETELWLWFGRDCDFGSSVPTDDDLKETIWSGVVICPQSTCSPPDSCEGSKEGYKIFGKEFDRTCYCPLGFYNPDAKTMENIKKLMILLKNKVDTQCT